jgi:hypothetical protein
MKLITFKEMNTVIAENQEEYIAMPAYVSNDGVITCCWELSFLERIKVIFTGKIWHQILTFNKPLQPQLLSIDKPL